jgi:hypothetical protein
MAEEDSVGCGWRAPEGTESGARAAAARTGARASGSPVADRRKSSSVDREHAVSAECVGSSPLAPARGRTAAEARAGRGSRSGSPARRAVPADRPPDDFLGAGFVAGSTFAQDQDVLLRLVRSNCTVTEFLQPAKNRANALPYMLYVLN